MIAWKFGHTSHFLRLSADIAIFVCLFPNYGYTKLIVQPNLDQKEHLTGQMEIFFKKRLHKGVFSISTTVIPIHLDVNLNANYSENIYWIIKINILLRKKVL